MKNIAIYLTIILFSFSCTNESPEVTNTQETTKKEATTRIISLNGTLTELLYELGLEDQIVGVDRTSTYPESTQEKTNLGHISQLNTEAILALKPTIILIDKDNAKNKALETLQNAGVTIKAIDIPFELEGVLTVAKELSAVLNQDFDTAELAKKIADNQSKINTLITNQSYKPKVLFIYARGAQMMMVAGTNTFAQSMIELVGGKHIMNEFESFKPLTPEALVAGQPDVILMFDSGLNSLVDTDKNLTATESLLSVTGVAQTPAGKNKKIISMEGLYLSGFGPRASDAALELAQKIYSN